MDLLSSINNSAIGSLYAVSAAKDVNGNDITGTYLTAVPEGYATTGDLTSKLETTAFSTVSGSFLTAQVVTSTATGALAGAGVTAINSTPILATGVKNGSIQIGSGDPGMYLTGQHGTAYYKANELIINRTGYGEQIKFNLGSAGSQVIGSAAGTRGAFINMSNGSHTAFLGMNSNEDAMMVLDGVTATPDSITSWDGVVSTVSNNSASWGGGSVPEGVLVESGLEYDDTEISGYSGSAFKDVALSETVATNSGAWGGPSLPISAGHGVIANIEDGKLVFKTDETVLWSGTGNSGIYNLSEPWDNFEKIRITHGCTYANRTMAPDFLIDTRAFKDEGSACTIMSTDMNAASINSTATANRQFYTAWTVVSGASPASLYIGWAAILFQTFRSATNAAMSGNFKNENSRKYYSIVGINRKEV